MRILITGAAGNVARGVIPRLRAAGHELVLTDLNRLPDAPLFDGLEFVQCDLQAGFGLERAVRGCDLVLHTAAWHGIHSGEKTELDFWRLNVDGTAWTLQAALAAGVKRLVFLSSMAWHDAYGKYGFTKRVGEELCEYARRGHGMRYVALRPADFTPWGNDWLNGYGARLLYGGVDRDDVLDCVEAAVRKLEGDLPPDAAPEGILVEVLRASAYGEADLAGWEADPLAACERVFPGSRRLVEKYAIDVSRKPAVGASPLPAGVLGCAPSRHFGTFLGELARLDAEGGEAAVRAVTCPY
jgi:NAD(P)-dependent dehydrogenase (short-subunit alcohol dehydrogenase family)